MPRDHTKRNAELSEFLSMDSSNSKKKNSKKNDARFFLNSENGKRRCRIANIINLAWQVSSSFAQRRHYQPYIKGMISYCTSIVSSYVTGVSNGNASLQLSPKL